MVSRFRIIIDPVRAVDHAGTALHANAILDQFAIERDAVDAKDLGRTQLDPALLIEGEDDQQALGELTEAADVGTGSSGVTFERTTELLP